MDPFEVYAYWDSLENQPQFDIGIDMKVWSRMFAMNVQSVSMNAAVELKHH